MNVDIYWIYWFDMSLHCMLNTWNTPHNCLWTSVWQRDLLKFLGPKWDSLSCDAFFKCFSSASHCRHCSLVRFVQRRPSWRGFDRCFSSVRVAEGPKGCQSPPEMGAPLMTFTSHLQFSRIGFLWSKIPIQPHFLEMSCIVLIHIYKHI